MRRGQPQFRQLLFRAYARRCAVSGTDQAETLEAAHIFPYAGVETNHVQNGLLLRADLHTMFDLGLWTIMPDFRVQLATTVSSAIYKAFGGSPIRLPSEFPDRPSAEALQYHRSQVFRG
jgi:predicted restriction endonuclease